MNPFFPNVPLCDNRDRENSVECMHSMYGQLNSPVPRNIVLDLLKVELGSRINETLSSFSPFISFKLSNATRRQIAERQLIKSWINDACAFMRTKDQWAGKFFCTCCGDQVKWGRYEDFSSVSHYLKKLQALTCHGSEDCGEAVLCPILRGWRDQT